MLGIKGVGLGNIVVALGYIALLYPYEDNKFDLAVIFRHERGECFSYVNGNIIKLRNINR